MPDTKITALTAIGANPIIPATFPIPMVDLTDTSMAASGTTKKVTVNQILGSGGTATLASATITGDLTVRTNRLVATTTGVGIGTTTLFGDLNIQNGSNCRLEVTSQAGGITIENLNNARNAYLNLTMFADAYIWNRLGSEAMRLNATGLGLGDSPSYKLHVARTADGTVGYFRRIGATINPALTIYCNETGNTVGFGTDYAGAASPAITFTTAGTERLRIDSSGNVISNVTGTAPTLATNSQMVFNLTSNTNLRISVRGTDGVTRTANITLA